MSAAILRRLQHNETDIAEPEDDTKYVDFQQVPVDENEISDDVRQRQNGKRDDHLYDVRSPRHWQVSVRHPRMFCRNDSWPNRKPVQYVLQQFVIGHVHHVFCFFIVFPYAPCPFPPSLHFEAQRTPRGTRIIWRAILWTPQSMEALPTNRNILEALLTLLDLKHQKPFQPIGHKPE